MSKNTYSEKLKDPRWQRKRLEVLKRDNFTCRDCGDTAKTLHVHHCHYCKGGPWETPLGLLLTVCEDCHEQRQALEEDARTALGWILAKSPLYSMGYADTVEDFTSSLARAAIGSETVGAMHTFDEMTEAYQKGMEDARAQMSSARHLELPANSHA